MAHRIGPPHAGRSTRLALFGILLAGCTHWQVQSVPPQQLVATQHPGKVRVTRPDSTKVVLSDPEIVDDMEIVINCLNQRMIFPDKVPLN